LLEQTRSQIVISSGSPFSLQLSRSQSHSI
jgi:hypothetical protein